MPFVCSGCHPFLNFSSLKIRSSKDLRKSISAFPFVRCRWCISLHSIDFENKVPYQVTGSAASRAHTTLIENAKMDHKIPHLSALFIWKCYFWLKIIHCLDMKKNSTTRFFIFSINCKGTSSWVITIKTSAKDALCHNGRGEIPINQNAFCIVNSQKVAPYLKL